MASSKSPARSSTPALKMMMMIKKKMMMVMMRMAIMGEMVHLAWINSNMNPSSLKP